MSSDHALDQSLEALSTEESSNEAAELCEQYFGKNDLFACVEVLRERNKTYKPEHTDLYFDTSLFPYRANESFDPPIPTLDDIIKARPDTTDSFTEHIWPVGNYFVKIGANAEIYMEAENLLYLARNTGVRVPKVYAAFTSEAENPLHYNTPGEPRRTYYYLIMERIQGKILEDINARELKPSLERKLWALLGEQFRQLRSVEPEDPTHFGRIQGRPYHKMSPLYYAPAPDFADYGPFNYEQLVQRMIRAAKIGSALSGYPDDGTTKQRSAYESAESVVLRGAGPSDRLPVLSHLDPQTHNIMVNLQYDENGRP